MHSSAPYGETERQVTLPERSGEETLRSRLIQLSAPYIHFFFFYCGLLDNLSSWKSGILFIITKWRFENVALLLYSRCSVNFSVLIEVGKELHFY